MMQEPDCLAGLLFVLVFGMLVTVVVVVSHPTPAEQQLLLNRLPSQWSGINWTQPEGRAK